MLSKDLLSSISHIDSLLKEAAIKLPSNASPDISSLEGKDHTVEVHPDMDHYYNVKGMIKDSGKPSVPLIHLKKKGVSSRIIDALPRDVHGHVHPEAIDEHIKKLPKHKVQVKVSPYTMGAQQHREGPQHVVSVGIHPENYEKMDPKHRKAWEMIRDSQHQPAEAYHKNQIGWARIDPNSKKGNDHWHIDEIQSDFQHPKKIEDKVGPVWEEKGLNADSVKHIIDQRERDELQSGGIKKSREKHLQDIKDENKERGERLSNAPKLHKYLSGNHEDPQHLIHSAVNELARKHGVESMSMDTPEDQAKQSMLNQYEGGGDEDDQEYRNDTHMTDINDYMRNDFRRDNVEKQISESPNKYLKSAAAKIPFDDLHEALQTSFTGSEPTEHIVDALSEIDNYAKLSDPEKDALKEYMIGHADKGPSWHDYQDLYAVDPQDREPQEREKAELPVHQIDTYNKRPKKLGMKDIPKTELFDAPTYGSDITAGGAHPTLPQGTVVNAAGSPLEGSEKEKVQYMKLHKVRWYKALYDASKVLQKSGYGPKIKGESLYNPADNARRKAKNTGDVLPSSTNTNVKAVAPTVFGSGKTQAGVEARIARAKSKKNPVKRLSPEEYLKLKAMGKADYEHYEDPNLGVSSQGTAFNADPGGTSVGPSRRVHYVKTPKKKK